MARAGSRITQNKLARLLKPLAIVPQKIRIGTETPKRLLPAPVRGGVGALSFPGGGFKPQHRNKADETGTSDVFQSATAETDVAVRKCEKSNNDGLCSDVAGREGGLGGRERKTVSVVH